MAIWVNGLLSLLNGKVSHKMQHGQYTEHVHKRSTVRGADGWSGASKWPAERYWSAARWLGTSASVDPMWWFHVVWGASNGCAFPVLMVHVWFNLIFSLWQLNEWPYEEVTLTYGTASVDCLMCLWVKSFNRLSISFEPEFSSRFPGQLLIPALLRWLSALSIAFVCPDADWHLI